MTTASRLMALRVASRFQRRLAREFYTPEALKDYLRDHPQADPKKHWVRKDKEKSKEEEDTSEGKKKRVVPRSKPLDKPEEAARVGVGGKEIPPPPKLPRLKNLRPDEAEIEARFTDMVESDPDGAAEEFLALAAKNKYVFETDAGKELLPEWSRPDLPPDKRGEPVNPERARFRGKYNAVLHQAANAIVKRAFLKRLDEIAKMPEDKRRILVTSGGVAAGKGTVVNARPDLVESMAATWDAAGEQNATENEWVLEECKKRDIRPTFVFVVTDPIARWPGVINRAKGIGRMVDAQLFADSYAIGAKNFDTFYRQHKDGGEVDFILGKSTLKDKSKLKEGEDPVQVDSLEEIPEEALNLDPHEVYEAAMAYTNEHKDSLPDYIYDGATFGTRAWKDDTDAAS